MALLNGKSQKLRPDDYAIAEQISEEHDLSRCDAVGVALQGFKDVPASKRRRIVADRKSKAPRRGRPRSAA